jgi:hypothetical protein
MRRPLSTSAPGRRRRSQASCVCPRRTPSCLESRKNSIESRPGEGNGRTSSGARELVYPFGTRSHLAVYSLDAERPALAGLSEEPSDGLEPSTPSYHAIQTATAGSRWQRFEARSSHFRPFGEPNVCHPLRPLCSIGVPSQSGENALFGAKPEAVALTDHREKTSGVTGMTNRFRRTPSNRTKRVAMRLNHSLRCLARDCVSSSCGPVVSMGFPARPLALGRVIARSALATVF